MSSPQQFPRLSLETLNAPADPTRRFRLLERVRARLRDGRYSRRTEEAYVAWIRRYVIFHDRRHPSDLGPEHVRQFLSALATEQRVVA
jgi:Phage integrase, N-terminal SAM-like domain